MIYAFNGLFIYMNSILNKYILKAYVFFFLNRHAAGINVAPLPIHSVYLLHTDACQEYMWVREEAYTADEIDWHTVLSWRQWDCNWGMRHSPLFTGIILF